MNENINQPNNMSRSRNDYDLAAELKRIKKKIRIFLMSFSLFFILAIGSLTFIDFTERSGCTEGVSAVVTDFISSTTEIDLDDSGSHKTSTGYAPVFEYTYKGVDYSNSNYIYSPKPSFEIGQKTELLVDPDNPDSIYAPEDNSIKRNRFSFFALWLVYILVVVIILPEILFRKMHEKHTSKG